MCDRLMLLLRERLENLSIILFELDTQIDEIRIESGGLDNLLIRLIQNNCLSENQENELRLLINELNLSIFLGNFNRVRTTFNQERISQIIE